VEGSEDSIQESEDGHDGDVVGSEDRIHESEDGNEGDVEGSEDSIHESEDAERMDDGVVIKGNVKTLGLKKGDIFLYKEDPKEIAEVLEIDEDKKQIYVSWLDNFKEIYDMKRPVDGITKQYLHYHPDSFILTSSKQDLDDPLTFDNVLGKKVIDVKTSSDIITNQRYIYDLGIIIPSFIAEYTPEELLEIQLQIDDMSNCLIDFIRKEGGGWKRCQNILNNLEGGNFSTRNSCFNHITSNLSDFHPDEKKEGICVWCNLTRPLCFYSEVVHEDGTTTKIGMGNICFPKYEHYVKIKKYLDSLLKRDKVWDISDSDLTKLTDLVEEAEIHYANDVSFHFYKKKRRRLICDDDSDQDF
jgi:hypothetical protein